MQENPLMLKVDGHTATITVNRPERRNALTPELLLSLGGVLSELVQDRQVRVVVLRGAGEEAFSAGYDITRIPTGQEFSAEQLALGENPLEVATGSLEECPLPVIAMIHGYCMGGALDVAVACDFRLASDAARLGITPAKLGIVYSSQGIQRFVNLIGPAHTKDLFYSGRLVNAQEAKAIGLVNRVIPSKDLEMVTYAFAQEIAENAPLSIRGTKTTIHRVLQCQGLSPAVEAELRPLQEQALRSEDAEEGQRAFRERRKPVFKGK